MTAICRSGAVMADINLSGLAVGRDLLMDFAVLGNIYIFAINFQ
jgi:hypothetical protein